MPQAPPPFFPEAALFARRFNGGERLLSILSRPFDKDRTHQRFAFVSMCTDAYETPVPENVTKGLEIVPVSRMDEVLSHALVRQPEPIEWKYDEEAAKAPVPDLSIDGDEAGSVAH